MTMQSCNFLSCVMMTSSNGNIFRVTGPLCGEFTGPGEFPTQRPVSRSFDVFFDLRLNKRLSKQPWGWWFETPSCHYDVIVMWWNCNVGVTVSAGVAVGRAVVEDWLRTEADNSRRQMHNSMVMGMGIIELMVKLHMFTYIHDQRVVQRQSIPVTQ